MRVDLKIQTITNLVKSRVLEVARQSKFRITCVLRIVGVELFDCLNY